MRYEGATNFCQLFYSYVCEIHVIVCGQKYDNCNLNALNIRFKKWIANSLNGDNCLVPAAVEVVPIEVHVEFHLHRAIISQVYERLERRIKLHLLKVSQRISRLKFESSRVY